MRFALAFAALACCPQPTQAQWQLQDPHTTADLRGIDSLGNGVAWASGTDGTVLRTEDAGFVWQLCAIPPNAEHLDFRGIQAFDNKTAIVMSSGKGDLSRLYKTTDGCQTWHLLLTNPDKDGFWDALSFFVPPKDALGRSLDGSHLHGYVLGDPIDGAFTLFSTADGGDTWSRRTAAKRGPKGLGCKIDNFEAKKDEAVFAASNESLLMLGSGDPMFITGGSIARIGFSDLFSLDGALCHIYTHFLDLPMNHGRPSSGAFAFAALPGFEDRGPFFDKIVIVGGDYKLPDATSGTAVTVSRVGRPLFQTIKTATTPPHGYRSAVAYDPSHNTWITVGPNGTDLSLDDGRNWRPLKPNPRSGDSPNADGHWNALSLPFVVGPHGRIGLLRADALPSATTPLTR